MSTLECLCFLLLTAVGCLSQSPAPSPTTPGCEDSVILCPYFTTAVEGRSSVIISPTPTGSDSSGDGAVSASGSGDVIEPIETTAEEPVTPTQTTIPTNLPQVYIFLTLTNLPLEMYGPDVMMKVSQVVSEILDLATPPLILVDMIKSSSDETVLTLYFPSEDDSNVLLFPAMLENSDNPAWLQIRNDYGPVFIEAIGVARPEDLPWWNWLIMAACATIAISAFLLLCSACCCRCRVKRKREQKSRNRSYAHMPINLVTPNGHAVQLHEREQLVRKISRINYSPRGQMQLLSHPLTVEELEELVANPIALFAEYASIPSNLVTVVEVPPGAEEKNRYNDVLPNPYSRVSLYLKFGVPNSDYINANFIRGYQNAAKVYIATQGPLYWTVADFWRMVWEQKCSAIVMTTGLEERGTAKCARYWPDERIMHATTYEDLEVVIKRRTATRDFTTTIFHLRHKEKMVSREVTHFWFTVWPDHGVPTATKPVIEFLLQARTHLRDIPGPTVVHCSAGIGRTGVFIGADIGMQQLEETGEVDILKIVSAMRQDRGGMVQTKEQYHFLHKVLLEYAHMVRSPYRGGGQRLLEPMQEETEEETTALLHTIA